MIVGNDQDGDDSVITAHVSITYLPAIEYVKFDCIVPNSGREDLMKFYYEHEMIGHVYNTC